ncbi:MAG: acyltransferase family protein, partial [Agathobacter sp.]|nr:acyltransferase family protein [Agathobacter sp.]
MEKLKRIDKIDNEYWNIVKGIGIILVVVAHLWLDLTRYLYIFHLPLFFFVSGYLYNEEKYGDNPYNLLTNRLKTSWAKYVLYYWVVILLHNVLLELKLEYLWTKPYSFSDVCIKMVGVLFGSGEGAFGLTLWFVPVLVISTCLLGFIVYYSRNVYEHTNNTLLKYGFQFLCILILTLIGYYFEKEKLMMHANAHVSLVVMPFLWGGYLLRNSKIDFKKYLFLIPSVIFGIIIYFVKERYWFDLVLQWIYPYMHIVAFLGIYMCLYVAKQIQRFPKAVKVFAMYGKASFWIMFVHLPLCRT